MPSKYLLPCECGASVPIETSQAGQSVPCACGRTLEIPSLRAIRALETTLPDAAELKTAAPQWNLGAGVLFAVGLSFALIAGAVASAAQFKHWQFSNYRPVQQNLDRFVAELDTATPTQLLDEWHAAREFGLGEHHSSPFVIAQGNADFFASSRNVALAIMVGGIVAATCSAFLRGRPASGK